MLIRVSAVVALLLAAQAGAATVYSSGFEAGYTSGAMPTLSDATVPFQVWDWNANQYVTKYHYPSSFGNALAGQSSPAWNVSAYSSDPTAGPDTFFLNSAFVVADPANASNHVAGFLGDTSGGDVPGSSASVVVPVNGSQDITFSQSAYFDSTTNASHSLLISALANGGCLWGGSQNLSFGNYGYFTERGNGTIWDGLTTGNQVAWSLWDANAGNYVSLLVPKDTWATASVTFHMASKTADFVVTANGVTQQVLGIDSSYLGGIVDGQTRYDMYVDGDTNVAGNIYLDNVSITQVPEPATLALIALGGLALLRRRANA